MGPISLIEFKVANFLSFKELTTFSMVAAKSVKEKQDTNTSDSGKNYHLLNSAVLYGNNASGKSNLIKAIDFMKNRVLKSYKESLDDEGPQTFSKYHFALNSNNHDLPMFFEAKFKCTTGGFPNSDKALNAFHFILRYGFEILNGEIKREWLFLTTKRETNLFTREGKIVKCNRATFKEGLNQEKDLKGSVLLISLLASFDRDISIIIKQLFSVVMVLDATHNFQSEFVFNKLKGLDSQEGVSEFIKSFLKSLEIIDFDLFKPENSLPDLFESSKDPKIKILAASLRDVYESLENQKLSIHTIRQKYNKDGIYIDNVEFDFESQESEGTQKLFYLLAPVYWALKYGCILVVDEIDSKLHPIITAKIFELFHKFNRHGAQLIAALHDVSVLNKDTFRRDQIWFVEKDQFGASSLVSLADFKTDKVRNQSAFNKNYIDGKYGGVPYLNIDAKIEESIYGKQ